MASWSGPPLQLDAVWCGLFNLSYSEEPPFSHLSPALPLLAKCLNITSSASVPAFILVHVCMCVVVFTWMQQHRAVCRHPIISMAPCGKLIYQVCTPCGSGTEANPWIHLLFEGQVLGKMDLLLGVFCTWLSHPVPHFPIDGMDPPAVAFPLGAISMDTAFQLFS